MFSKKTVWLRIAFALPVSLLLFLAACKPGSSEVMIEQGTGGSNVTVKTDQVLAVRLESNPTTGYSWGIAECDESILKPQGEPLYVTAKKALPITGAGGWEVFRFKPETAGQAHLKLIYRRPWEKDVEPLYMFEVDVNVQ